MNYASKTNRAEGSDQVYSSRGALASQAADAARRGERTRLPRLVDGEGPHVTETDEKEREEGHRDVVTAAGGDDHRNAEIQGQAQLDVGHEVARGTGRHAARTGKARRDRTADRGAVTDRHRRHLHDAVLEEVARHEAFLDGGGSGHSWLQEHLVDSYSIVLSRPPVNLSEVNIAIDPPPGLVFVDSLKTEFGKRETIGYAKIYETAERAEQIERTHIIERNTFTKPKEASSEAS